MKSTTPRKYYYKVAADGARLEVCQAMIDPEKTLQIRIGSTLCGKCEHCIEDSNPPERWIICDIIDKATNG